MKVIKGSSKEFECSCCGTKFVLEKTDNIYEGVVDRIESFLPGLYDYIDGKYVFCPNCKQKVVIKYDY